MAKRLLIAVLGCMVVLALAELWLRHNLFARVSYSNSESIDAQLHDRAIGGPWKVLFIGDSEVRWGVDPVGVDAGLADAGVSTVSFNHAFDGFGAGWWTVVLPRLLQSPDLARVETIALGVQLIEQHEVMSDRSHQCGSLQRPVLTSPLAVDLQLDGLCRDRAWDATLGREAFSGMWLARYAPSVRRLLLPKALFEGDQLRFNSRTAGPPNRGFQPHRAIAQDQQEAQAEFGRWKAQYVAERDFKPLPQEAWVSMTSAGGFFDQLHQIVQRSGRRLVLFALPTNPQVIDTLARRPDYERNTALLGGWASRRQVTYIDLGIQDRPDATAYFSDMRHLSGAGAAEFSRKLGKAMGLAQQRKANPLRTPTGSHGETSTSAGGAGLPDTSATEVLNTARARADR